MKKSAISALAVLAGAVAATPAFAVSDFTYSTYNAQAKAAEQNADPKANTDGAHWAPTTTSDWPAKPADVNTTGDLGFATPVPPLRIELGMAFEHDRSGNGTDSAEGFLPGGQFGVSLALTPTDVVTNRITYFAGKSSLAGEGLGGHGASRSLLEIVSQYKLTRAGWHDIWFVGGLGYRMADQDFLGNNGYSFGRNQRVYMSVGVERPFPLVDGLTVTPRADVKGVVYGHQYLDYQGGTSLSQHGVGSEIAADLTYRSGGRDYVVSPYARGWFLKSSGSNGLSAATQNNEREVGVSLSVKF